MERNTGNYEEGSSSTHQRPASSQAEWVIDIYNHIKEGPHSNSDEFIISRVPPSMRIVDENNYIPKLVSIGPFHLDNPSLKAREAQKLRFLYGLLDPISKKPDTVESSVKKWRVENVTLDGLVKAMKELERKTREHYSEEFDALSSDEFVRMMVIDGCFIVELLRLHAVMTYKRFNNQEDVDDPIFSARFMLPVIRLDLLMLENQLPLFVLQMLYKLTGPDKDEASFTNLAINFFNPLVPGRGENATIGDNNSIHLLALFQSSFITKETHTPFIARIFSTIDSARSPKRSWLGSCTELRCADISFKKKKKKTGCFLEIGFENGVLEIPPLFLDEGMIQFLRNAVAYEQCDESAEPYFTTLVLFFDTLVISPKEAEFLRWKGIIQTHDSNEETVDVLHKLTKGILCDMNDCYISEVIEKINEFTGKRWNLFKGTMKMRYIIDQKPTNPVILYLTLVQTFASVCQFVFDSSKHKKS